MISDKDIRRLIARAEFERGLLWSGGELSDSAAELAAELLAARKVVRAARSAGSIHGLVRIDKALASYDKATRGA